MKLLAETQEALVAINMTIKQKYILYTFISVLINVGLIYALINFDMHGIFFLLLILLVVVSGFIFLSLLIASLAKDPAKVFKVVLSSLFDIFTPIG